MTNTVHLLTLTETRPGYPPTLRAICGHKSETKQEFSISLAAVTCEECLRLAKVPRLQDVKL